MHVTHHFVMPIGEAAHAQWCFFEPDVDEGRRIEEADGMSPVRFDVD